MRKRVRASYTVEAAILMPIVLILVGVICEKGIEMYQKTKEQFAVIDGECQTQPLETLWRLQMTEDVMEEFGWK